MPEQPPRPRTSFARIIVTPLIVILASYLIAGPPGLAVGAALGVIYILIASRR